MIKALEVPNPGKLSIIIIAKNEEKNIAACLDSCLPVSDEIIVNNNGSSDKTAIITASKDDDIRLINSKCENHFSKARNQCIANASMGWLLYIDADDRIPKACYPELTKLKSAPADRVFCIPIQNTKWNGLPYGGKFYQTRMFPNHPKLRFIGRAHEQITYAIKQTGLPKIYIDMPPILHTGYEDDKHKRAKALRNLELMRMEEANNEVTFDDPADNRLWAISRKQHRAEAHYILDEWEKGIELYEELYKTPGMDKINPNVHFSLPTRIGGGYQALKQYEKAIEWYDKSSMLHIEAVYQKARCLEHLKHYEKAILMYYQVFLIKKREPESLSIEHDSCRLFSFHFLARLLMQYNRHNEVLKLFYQLSKEYPESRIDDA